MNTRLGSRNGRPLIIRKVTKVSKDGRAKIARDRKTLIQMERVKARGTKVCGYYHCPHPLGHIVHGTEHAVVTSPMRTKRMGHRDFPDPRAYHFECVPPEARPLVRFFDRMVWKDKR